ncbi:hypothetical protein B0181_09535 [Moraxella caviae]|uniref:Uncharacterized protein n=1 Tax=Moraxella caviae TaxID=34060 RepID=A0A1S9ZWD4_9GAMM|nr:hypothetical protein [Moraxella caviae]OOR87788.1 hypothetical protein B0181_09535 [Moraxella caviae]STZ10544.1 Uncharacterised protein [Moraxella caviae]VEW11345.1 Uncharacterised protein [Moraxella caviae]
MYNDDKLGGIAVIAMMISSLVVWVGSGWWLWELIEVTGFGRGVMWLLAWGLVGGIARTFIAPLISVAIIAIFDIFVSKE